MEKIKNIFTAKEQVRIEKNSFTAKEMDGGFVSGNYVVKKLNHYPEDIISLLDADKIKAYERFSIPTTSFQQEAKYWEMWHWEAKKLTIEKVPGLYFSRKEIENLNTKKAGRKATDYDAFNKLAIFMKKENPQLTKAQLLKDKALRSLYPSNVADNTLRKALSKALKEAGLDYKDKPGRPKNRT
jgi:hypothetical protein